MKTKRWCILLIFLVQVSCKSRDSSNNEERVVVVNDTITKGIDADSGYLKWLALTKHGKKNGMFLEYFRSGEIRSKGRMQNDKKQGLWITYNQKNVVTSAQHYFEDSVVMMLDANDFHFQRAYFFDSVCSFLVPSKWTQIVDSSTGRIAVAVVKESKLDNFNTNIVFSFFEQDSKGNFNQFVKQYIEALKTNQGFRGIVYETELIIDSSEVYQIGVQLQCGSANCGEIITIYSAGKNIIVFNGMSASNTPTEFFKYKGLFEQVASTFKKEKKG